MAAKKAASKKAAPKKGDEPVRMGRAKEQKVKGFISDPYGWMDPKVFRQIRSARGLGREKDGLLRVPKDADARKYGETAGKEAKKLVEQAKKKYGTKFVVDIGPDTEVSLRAGATKKGIKAQSARMTKQSNRITSLPKKKK